MPPQNADEKLLQRRVADLVKAAFASGKPKFTGFLNDREAALAEAELNRHRNCGFRFYGGYDGAERNMLCVFEDIGSVPENFPITPVRISVTGGELTHRDYLGALLGAGLERGCIGDILAEGSGAVVYTQEHIVPFLREEIKSVGRYDAQVAPVAALPGPSPQAGGEERRASVASLRLDAVLSAMLNISRSDAAAMVARGFVQVNHLLVENGHYQIQEGDVFSVRGRGKYRIAFTGGKSRKNRIFIEYIQY